MKTGRPLKVTKAVLQKLEKAFLLDCTDEEACFAADIGTSTLYNYQIEHPEFLERKRELKKNPVFQARQSVIRGMKKDPALALKYLERKRKNEFSTKTKAEVESNITLSMSSILEEINGTSSGLPTDQGEA